MLLLGAVIDKEADAAEQQPTSEVYGQTDNNYKSESNKSNSVQHQLLHLTISLIQLILKRYHL
jgi:hypothetical protein